MEAIHPSTAPRPRPGDHSSGAPIQRFLVPGWHCWYGPATGLYWAVPWYGPDLLIEHESLHGLLGLLKEVDAYYGRGPFT